MRHLLLRLVVALSVLLVTQTASAAIDKSGVLDTVADRFMTESATPAQKLAGLVAGFKSPTFKRPHCSHRYHLLSGKSPEGR